MQQIQWQNRFSIGVEMIDQAHHRLFSIVQKIMDLYVERHENKFACVEGIKYFKAYALKHFAEEEAYMREIGYPGYLAHKKHHDRMKYETLPELERLLYESDFSTEMVQRFIGVCTGWLTGHIIIEDRAIIGGRTNELAPIRLDDELSVIQSVIITPLEEILECPIQFTGRFSVRDVILNEQYCQLTYRAQKGEQLRVILVMGQQMLLHAAGLMFGTDFYEKNEIVCFAIQEIAQNLIQRAAVNFGREPDEFQLEKGRFLERGEFIAMFGAQPPQYSLLFHADQESFAVCIDQIPVS
nr:hemerythrin family protein [uncultured Acetatifactor sp.]